MRNGEIFDGSRRRFLKRWAGLLAASAFAQACRDTARQISARFSGAAHTLGHRLMAPDNFPPATGVEHVQVLVVGGGIAGLSACRALAKRGVNDFLLLELEQRMGGNSASAENPYTPHPLGAHYLPLPNRHDTALLEFLREENIVTGFDAQGEPTFDETYLTAAPQARLYIRDYWQEGLIPAYGVPGEEQAQIRDFFQSMDAFKQLRGLDGKYVFDIPVKNSSTDPAYRQLDHRTLQAWLQEEGYTAGALLEHIDYCCLDDFGVGMARVSAWAGIHYFAARKSEQDKVLTWPEGNGFLVKCLEKHAAGRIRRQHLAFKVTPGPEGVAVQVYDAAQNRTVLVQAEKVILATPQFVNGRLLPQRDLDLSPFHYAPWLVATLVLRGLPSGAGMPLCWDNVIFKGKGLGYIDTQHQSVAQVHPKTVLTYYRAFDGPDPLALRRELYRKPESYWQGVIFDDLRQAHPGIESFTERVDIQRWGHGMISPLPGFLFGPALAAARQPIDNRIFFAHSDLSGMSLFEEAFHQGLDAAAQVYAGLRRH